MLHYPPLQCFVFFFVRKRRADSGGLGLGLLSSKTLTFKHSLLSFHVSVSPRLYFLLSLLVCFFLSHPAPSFFPFPSICLRWMCICLSPQWSAWWIGSLVKKSFSAFCFWQRQVSRNCCRQVYVQHVHVSNLHLQCWSSLSLCTQAHWIWNETMAITCRWLFFRTVLTRMIPFLQLQRGKCITSAPY